MKNPQVLPVSVLLVDDNKLGSTARKMILTEAGYRVETAGSGEEAWAILEKEQFDIVVTDYKMAGMNGVELIGRIRAAMPQVHLILLSGASRRWD